MSFRFITPLLTLSLLLSACSDSVSEPEPNPEPAPAASYSGTLPVMHINTTNSVPITSKEVYVQADWWIDDMGVEGCESIGSQQHPLSMLIKGQGNYTWDHYPKKSYRLKFDTKQEPLGMSKNRHFVLLAHADDDLAMLKNTMGFELSRRIGLAYTPAQQPVEVVLNGNYLGLYFLTEKIRTGKSRVDIADQHEMETDPTSIATGGWLLEIDNHPGDNCMNILERDGVILTITHHSPEVLSTPQLNYLNDWISRVNEAIYTTDKTSTLWEEYIDIDTLAMYYIVGEIMDEMECFSGSCYLYKRQGEGNKLIFGPVWDFGNAYQRWAIYQDTRFEYYLYQQPTMFTSHWIEEISRFPHFVQVVKKHWREFYGSGFNGLDVDKCVFSHVARIREAYQADAKLWPHRPIDSQCTDFKTFFGRKVKWLQSQWGE